jgi:PAS domain S-box-containing protein
MTMFLRITKTVGIALAVLLSASMGTFANYSNGFPEQSIQSGSETGIELFTQSVELTVNKLHEAIHALPDIVGSELFEQLSELHQQSDQKSSATHSLRISALAMFSTDRTWLAWSGSVMDLPSEWMTFLIDSEPGESFYLLYETPGAVMLLHISTSLYRIVMSQIMLSDRSIVSVQNHDVSDTVCPPGYQCQYQSPFRTLPGVSWLQNGLNDDGLNNVLIIEPATTETQIETLRTGVLSRFDLLSDPHFFAGEMFGFQTAGIFLLAGLIMWILTHFLRPLKLPKYGRCIAGLIALIFLILTWRAAIHVASSLIWDTRSAWWPDFLGEHGMVTLVLPVSGLLITGAWFRVVFWLLSILFMKPAAARSGRRIPGWLCMAAAVVWLTPFLIHNADRVNHANVTARIMDWVQQRETIFPLALESNLELLADNPVLDKFFDQHTVSGFFPAFRLWRASDLHVLKTAFSVQILDSEGFVLDRFSPDFLPDTLHSETLLQAVSEPSGHLILSSQIHQSTLDSPLTGIKPLIRHDDIIGFLIVQISSDIQTIIPQPGQWGHETRIFRAYGGENYEWPLDSPVPLQIEWLENLSTEPQLVTDPSGNFNVMLYQLPYSEPVRPEIIMAVFPIPSALTHLSGFSRLALLAMTLLIPGILYREMMLLVRTRFQKIYPSFTRQLLGAFLVPVIILPIILAVTIHRVITETESGFQTIQMKQVLQHYQLLTLERITDKAMLLQAEIEQQLIHFGDVNKNADFPWIILDGFGRIRMSHDITDDYELPLATITRVFQDNFFRNRAAKEIVFISHGPGVLSAQVVLPFPGFDYADDVLFPGTFVCEIPVTGQFVRSLSDPADTVLDIYATGSITASNRPEIFNTGLRSNRLESQLYRKLVFDGEKSITKTDRLQNIHSIIGALRNEAGETVAALDIYLPDTPFDTRPMRLQEWLYPTTLFLLLTGIALSLFFGHRIAQPVQALTDSSQEIAAGNFSIHVKEKGVGEIRQLMRTFNLMIRDLDTQRKILQERHAFISALLARMSSAIVAVDDSGNIVTINHAFDEIFPVSGKQFLNKPIRTLFTQAGIGELESIFDQYDPKTGDYREVIRYFKAGRIVHLSVVMTSLESPDHRTGTLIVLDDISDTVQSSKLQAYADLARRIAHEVKNPLTPIQLSIEHLRQAWEDGAPEFPEVFNQCMAMILDEVKSLERISTEFSRFARFPKPVFKTGDIRELMTEIETMYRSISGQIHVKTDLPDQPLLCRFDRDQMKRALVNLVHNAVQALSGQRGTILLRATETDGWIILEIEDSGHGMDDETLVHLFEPYFSTKKEGTGLGLVITRAVIDAHEGDIRVSSREGSGTCFTIRLATVSRINESSKGDNNVEKNDTGN